MARREITERGRTTPAPKIVTPLGETLIGSIVIDVEIPGDPTTKSRPRLGSQGVYTPRRTVQAERDLQWYFLGAHVQADADHELAVDVRFVTSTRQRRDLDNLLKLLLDAANGWLWRDDVQVVRINAEVQRGGSQPGTYLRVTRVGRLTSDCQRCGRVIAKDSGAVVRGTYCSRACYDATQRKGNTAPCDQCGAPVYRQASRDGRRFCDSSCRSAFIRGRPREQPLHDA